MFPESKLQAQEGPQRVFLASEADVAIYGGAAGGGKSFAIILEACYNVDNPLFRAVIFRKTFPQIRQPNGLWDTSQTVYRRLGAEPRETDSSWTFRSGAVVRMAGMELEQDKYSWDGSSIDLIAFDELQQFSSSQFWHMFARNRSVSGVKPRIRGSCNPDADSWLRAFLSWWIDGSGLPIKERSGVLRWFVRIDDQIHWSDTSGELVEKFGAEAEPKSCTFVSARVTDNKILLAADPSYISNLKALSKLERDRLLNGNWDVRAEAGSYFKREWFAIVDCAPAEVAGRVRYWDRAATEQKPGTDPDASIGLLLSKDAAGVYYVEDVRKMFATPLAVERAMQNCAGQDGVQTAVGFMQDPGSAGVGEAQGAARALDGFDVRYSTATGDKETRAKPVSAQAEAGNVKLVKGPWNDEFLRVLENFPVGRHDDEVDALSGAHGMLLQGSGAFDNNSTIHIPPDTRLGTRRSFAPRTFHRGIPDEAFLERLAGFPVVRPEPPPPAPKPEPPSTEELARRAAELEDVQKQLDELK
jgi:predicted phage terminase large subunit-like protein